MGRDNKNYAPVMSSTTMTGTNVLTSDPVKLFVCDKVGFHVVWTGTPTGNFTVEVSNDDGLPSDVSTPTTTPSITNWTLVTGSTSAAGGAAGSLAYELSTGFKWARLKYTNSASTGTITSFRVTAKGP